MPELRVQQPIQQPINEQLQVDRQQTQLPLATRPDQAGSDGVGVNGQQTGLVASNNLEHHPASAVQQDARRTVGLSNEEHGAVADEGDVYIVGLEDDVTQPSQQRRRPTAGHKNVAFAIDLDSSPSQQRQQQQQQQQQSIPHANVYSDDDGDDDDDDESSCNCVCCIKWTVISVICLPCMPFVICYKCYKCCSKDDVD